MHCPEAQKVSLLAARIHCSSFRKKGKQRMGPLLGESNSSAFLPLIPKIPPIHSAGISLSHVTRRKKLPPSQRSALTRKSRIPRSAPFLIQLAAFPTRGRSVALDIKPREIQFILHAASVPMEPPLDPVRPDSSSQRLEAIHASKFRRGPVCVRFRHPNSAVDASLFPSQGYSMEFLEYTLSRPGCL